VCWRPEGYGESSGPRRTSPNFFKKGKRGGQGCRQELSVGQKEQKTSQLERVREGGRRHPHVLQGERIGGGQSLT